MKLNNLKVGFTGIVLLLLFINSGCSTNDDTSSLTELITTPIPEEIIQAIPTLRNFSPTSGLKTTLVTINGANFGINTTQVFFNDVEAIVESVTATQITAKVPISAGTGLVKVISEGTTLIGQEFTYILTTSVTTLAGGSLAGATDGTGIDARFNNPRGITIDGQGNLYIAGGNNHKIRKVTPNGAVTTLAGSTSGFTDETGTNAQFDLTFGVVLDAQENLYITDVLNRAIRKITPSTVVSTFTGGTFGTANGTGIDAEFAFPTGITIDAQDNLYVTDGSRIRKITPTRIVTTIAGSGAGFEDGTTANAKFHNPKGITVDAQGNLYIADTQNHKIRKIDINGTVSTLAGSTAGFQDGSTADAKFNNPRGITIDSQGNLYIADSDNHKIRKISTDGVVSTIAGSTRGFADGNADDSKFKHPNGLSIDAQGNLYVVDEKNHRIRKITQD